MAKKPTKNPEINLTLRIDTKSNKVCFAEASKDFVDFLFGLLELPLRTILKLLAQHDDTAATFGSITRVYQSVQNLDNDHLQPNQTKDTLLTPKIGASNTAQTTLLEQLIAMADPPNQTNVNTVHGCVKGEVTYMVMDNLIVKPMPIPQSKDNKYLQKTVKVDRDEGLKLFKKAFSKSTTVLTDIFLERKPTVLTDKKAVL